MFRIGEFSRIAQVSGRLLRYYDELDLLKPIRIDPETGYRYYSAEQLPRLNRILALKDLGLSLEQIGRLLNEPVTPDEIRGMLTIRKAQIEQALQNEIARLRNVEMRLNQIETEGDMWTPDVVIKQVPAQQVLSVRAVGLTGEDFWKLFAEMQRRLPSGPARRRVGSPFFLMHSDFEDESEMDLEMGYLLEGAWSKPLALTAPHTLTPRELPGVATMATLVHQGFEGSSASYNALGAWIEANHYEILGPGREIILKLSWPENINETVMEIQFPVQKQS
ncbi:MAG: MerR family transcriptional regulator [Chloroflexi bacterium]|nr:MAG: MerR family transcriptional regulator [Chloroflexota bacterium]